MAQPIDLVTRTWGTGDRQVLLLHGLSSSSASWWRVGADIARLGFRVLAPDLRGHGATGHLDSVDEDIDGYIADVRAVGGGWVFALGHSLGGRILVDCQLADPTFARAVVLEDPALHIPDDPQLLTDLASEYDTHLSDAAFAQRYPRWSREDVAGKLEALRQSSPAVAAATLAALVDGDHWPKLHSVAVPALVMGAHPDNGGFVTDELGAGVAKQANVEYVGIRGAGHSIHRDSYDAFWAALVSFLGRNGLGAG